MKTLLQLLALLSALFTSVQLGVSTAVAQEVDLSPKPAKNSIYLEGFGAGGFYSVNYERLFIDQLALRVGFSYLTFEGDGLVLDDGDRFHLGTIPVTIGCLVGNGRHSLELGAGATLAIASMREGDGGGTDRGATVFGTSFAGYRLHPMGTEPGFQFRIGVMLLYGRVADEVASDEDDDFRFGVVPSGYLSFGVGF